MSVRSTRAALVCVAVVAAALIAAAAAFADRISYAVGPTPAGQEPYTVTAEGGGHGIVKVTYNGCPTAGQATSFPLTLSTNGSGTASPVILKDEGDGTLTVSPFGGVISLHNSSTTVTVTITPQLPSNHGVQFRLKYKGDEGQGLGEGPGVMVRVNCVSTPPIVTPTPPPPTQTPPPTTTSLTTPTTPTPPAAVRGTGGFGVLGTQTAGCVAVPRSFRVRVHEASALHVTIRSKGKVVPNAKVRIFVPGHAPVIKRTGKNGTVTFRVNPKTRGTVILQSTECAGTARIRVQRAHITATRVTPRFTG